VKKEAVFKYCQERLDYYRGVERILQGLENKTVYKVTHAYQTNINVIDGKCVYDIAYNTFIGEMIYFSLESVRFKVLAGENKITKYGQAAELSVERDKEKWAPRRDTITIKFDMLLHPLCKIEVADKDDLITNIGCKFIHPDIQKHL
jgi:hypothetical protein